MSGDERVHNMNSMTCYQRYVYMIRCTRGVIRGMYI